VDFILVVFLLLLVVFVYAYIKLKLRKKKKTGFGVPTESRNGTLLDSKQEKVVADYFDDENVHWTHGELIHVNYTKYDLLSKITFGFIKPQPMTENIKTDFVLPFEDEKIYIEYFGMINVKGKVGKQYRKRHNEKLKYYKIGKLKLVSLYPEDLEDLKQVFPERLKQDTGVKFSNLKKTQKNFVFCNECGNRLPKDTKFCDGCGNEL